MTDLFTHNWRGHVWPLAAATWLLLLLTERVILSRQKIVFERNIGNRLYLGRSASIRYRIQNKNKYPVRLLTNESLPEFLHIPRPVLQWDLSEHQCQHQSLSLTPVATGEAQFECIRLTILGRLALAWWTRSLAAPQSVTILPDYRIQAMSAYPTHSATGLMFEPERYPSLTLVINVDQVNQLLSDHLCRVDHYLNACSAMAYQALAARRPVNIIVYDDAVRCCVYKVQQLHQLDAAFEFMRTHRQGAATANHRCIIPSLDKIHPAGLLVWYTDHDAAGKTVELEKICRLYKQRFNIVVHSRIASESKLMTEALKGRRHKPQYKLEIFNLQQQWRYSRRILHGAGIRASEH